MSSADQLLPRQLSVDFPDHFSSQKHYSKISLYKSSLNRHFVSQTLFKFLIFYLVALAVILSCELRKIFNKRFRIFYLRLDYAVYQESWTVPERSQSWLEAIYTNGLRKLVQLLTIILKPSPSSLIYRLILSGQNLLQLRDDHWFLIFSKTENFWSS